MAKELVFKLGDNSVTFSISKVSREKLYGKKEIDVVNSFGEECIAAYIDSTGAFIIPKGGTAFANLDNFGNWVDRSEIKAVDLDGNILEKLPSSFSSEISLIDTITTEQFLEYAIQSVYHLKSETLSGDFIEKIARERGIFCFDFLYRDDYEPSKGFILESGGELFILTGYKIDFEMVGIDEVDQYEEEEEFIIDDDDLDFDF